MSDDDLVLDNMASLIRPRGSIFVEFRNKLFSLFTLNRYTAEFILDDLLRDVSPTMRERVSQDLHARLRMDVPAKRDTLTGTDAPGYDAILSRFHNPFEVGPLFERHGFCDIRLLWYHYHPAMPYLEPDDPDEFRREAISLEREPSNWRGFFLCSAFVVEATRGQPSANA